MKTSIPLEKIPSGVIEEISIFYEIDYSIYGTVETPVDARTRKLMFTQVEQENVTSDITDPMTFTRRKVTGDLVEGFLARGIWDDERKSVQLWQVTKTGPVLRENQV